MNDRKKMYMYGGIFENGEYYPIKLPLPYLVG